MYICINIFFYIYISHVCIRNILPQLLPISKFMSIAALPFYIRQVVTLGCLSISTWFPQQKIWSPGRRVCRTCFAITLGIREFRGSRMKDVRMYVATGTCAILLMEEIRLTQLISGFYTSQMVQDFFHQQQYVKILVVDTHKLYGI